MYQLTPFLPIEAQYAGAARETDEQVFGMLGASMPSCFRETLYARVAYIDSSKLVQMLISKPCYGFLESRHGKALLDVSEQLQLATGMLTTLSGREVVESTVLSDGHLIFYSKQLSLAAFSTILATYYPSTFERFADIAMMLLYSDGMFLALCCHVERMISYLQVYEQVAAVLTLFYPVLAMAFSNCHTYTLARNLTEACAPLAFAVVCRYYDAIVCRVDFVYAQIITKLLTRFDTSGIFREHFRCFDTRENVVVGLQYRIQQRENVLQLTKSPKHFREVYAGSISDFALANELQYEVLFEILSRNLEDLKLFFESKIASVYLEERNPFLRIVRQCLADFLLSGEGQAVEKVINVIAQVAAEKLGIDTKSCLFVVCGCTMINTQFDFELQGKKLQRYITQLDFINLMQQSPGIDSAYFSQSNLEEIYASLKYMPLGINHSILKAISCYFMTVDAGIAASVPNLPILLPSYQKDRPNYDRRIYLIRAKELFARQEIFDNSFAIVPVILEHALYVLEAGADLQQIEYYTDCIVQYSNSFDKHGDGTALISIMLSLMTASGLLDHQILVENDFQQIKSLISNTYFAVRIALVSATALKILHRVSGQLNDEQARMAAIFVLNLQILGFSNVFYYSAIDYYAILSDNQQLQLVRQKLSFTQVFKFNEFNLFTLLFRNASLFLREIGPQVEISLYDNIKYLIFTHISSTLQPVPATKSVSYLQVSQKYQYVAIYALLSLCVFFLENAPQPQIGMFANDICQNMQDLMNLIPASAQQKVEKQLQAKFDFPKTMARLKTAVLVSSIGALATKDVSLIYQYTKIDLKLTDYVAIQQYLTKFPRYRQAVQQHVPSLFNFTYANPTQLASACVASIVSDDVLGLKETLRQIHNLSSLYYINQMLGLQDIDLALLKRSRYEFFERLQKTCFQPVQQDFVADSIGAFVEQKLLARIGTSIAARSGETVGLLIGAMLLQIEESDESVKILIAEYEIGLVELTIAIICRECGVELEGDRWSWLSVE